MSTTTIGFAVADEDRERLDRLVAQLQFGGATGRRTCGLMLPVMEALARAERLRELQARSAERTATAGHLWKAARSFYDKGEPAAEEWVAAQARKILHGNAGQVAAGIRPPRHNLWLLRRRARRCRRMRPLPGQQEGPPRLRHRAEEMLAHRHRDHRKEYAATSSRTGWTSQARDGA
jgi:hypothetical protein